MRSGRFKHRFSLQRKVARDSDFVGKEERWEKIGNVLAGSLEPLSGSEQLVAQQVQSLVTHKLTLHWSTTTATLKGGDRAERVSDGRIFAIESATNVNGRNYFVECQVIEREDD